MMRLLSMIVTSLLVGCSDPAPDKTNLNVTVTFPDADAADRLPLDPADGFPFRVKVSTPLSNLQGAIKAHVVVVGASTGPSFVTPGITPVMDTVVALGIDSDNQYSTIVTMNALGPGPVAIQAEVAGAFGSGKIGTTIVDPLLKSAVSETTIWSGAVPRYAVCVESSAIKGTINLTSDDPAVLGNQGSLSATLSTGPCTSPAVNQGPGVSHADFSLSFAPPFSVVATLAGRPVTADPGAWTTVIDIPASLIPTVKLSASAKSTGQRTAAGTIFAVTANAMQTGDGVAGAVAGLSVTFGALGGGSAPSPATVTTDVSGNAVTFELVPYDSAVTLQLSGGGAFAQLTIAGQSNPIVLGLSSVTTGTTLPSGTLHQVTATTTIDGAPAEGVTVSFSVLSFSGTANAPTIAPSTITTDATGKATVNVVIPSGAQVLIQATLSGINVGDSILVTG